MAFDPISAAIIGGTSLLSGMMSSNAAESAANAQLQAGREAAQAQLESARIAADAAKFRPYSLTTGFGRSFFNCCKPHPHGYINCHRSGTLAYYFC